MGRTYFINAMIMNEEDHGFLFDFKPCPFSDIVFNCPQKDGEGIRVLRLCHTGEIYVNGKFVENDKDVVESLRIFLKSNLLYRKI